MTTAAKTTLCVCIFLALSGLAGVAAARDHDGIRSCVVSETMDSGGYTYIRCRENGEDIWLAVMQMVLGIGDRISFQETPPMVNFTSKGLNRTFPKVMFVPGVSRNGLLAPQSPLRETRNPGNAPPTEEESLYAGADETGALVFTDDPSKAPKSASLKRRTTKVHNGTVLENFSATERKLILMQEQALNAYCSFDLDSLRSITTDMYWPTLEEGLVREGGNAASFLRNFCFSEFRVATIKQYRETSTFDGLSHSFADMEFVASRTVTQEGGGEDLTCKASFIKEPKGWKYIDISCGGSRGM